MLFYSDIFSYDSDIFQTNVYYIKLRFKTLLRSGSYVPDRFQTKVVFKLSQTDMKRSKTFMQTVRNVRRSKTFIFIILVIWTCKIKIYFLENFLSFISYLFKIYLSKKFSGEIIDKSLKRFIMIISDFFC